jgi:hypothetical protein
LPGFATLSQTGYFKRRGAMLEDQSMRRALASPVIQWLASLMLSAAIVLIAVLVVLSVVDHAYIQRNPIAATEEDLGYGLVMVFSLIASAVVALPAWGLLAWRISRAIERKVA